MSRYIDKDLILYRKDSECGICTADKRHIDSLPTADVRENVRGEWIFPYGDKKYKRCSVCGRVFYSIPYNTNFCPNCGADMRG